MTIRAVDIAEGLATIDAPWTPRIAAALNGQHVKLARLEGAFVWHAHAEEDELFLVVRGTLRIELREEPDVVLHPWQMVVIPRGVEHRPVADEPVEVLLFEPASTCNTGDADDPRKVESPEWIQP